jgi:heme-degrading monooxygenase HmoA
MTYVALDWLKFDPGQIEEGAERLREVFVAAGQGASRGLISRIGGDTLVGTSFWESEDAAAEFRDRAQQRLGDMARPHALAKDAGGGEQVFELRVSSIEPAYLRFVVLKVKPGRYDEVLQTAEQLLPPLFRSRPGFVQYTMIRPSDSLGVFVSGWEAKAQATAAVLGSVSAIKQTGLSLVAIGRILPAFIAFDSYVGQVLFASSPAGALGTI